MFSSPRGIESLLSSDRTWKIFATLRRFFLEGKAAIQIKHAGELAGAIRGVLSNPDFAAELGRNAGKVVDQNTGATDRVLTFLQPTEARW